MKRSVVLLCTLAALTIGCGPTKYIVDDLGQSSSWELALVAWEMRPEVWMSHSSKRVAKWNHTWLLIHASMTNLADELRRVEWIDRDELYFIDEHGTKYPIGYRNATSGFYPYLPSHYKAGETGSGFVMFEVPLDTDVSRGSVLFRPMDGRTVYFELSDLPPI